MLTYRSNPPSRSIPPRREVQPRHRELHAQIIRYLALTGMSESRLGLAVVNDPAFVSRLRADDYEMTSRTERRVRSFIAEALENA